MIKSSFPSLDEKETLFRGGIFKVVNYNVNFVNARNPKRLESNALYVFHALFKSDADVICLEETHSGYEAAFKEIKWKDVMHLKFDDSNIIPSDNLDPETCLVSLYPNYVFYNHRAAGGMAFLSKYPFENNSEICLATNERIDGKRVVDGSWFPMQLISVQVPIKNHVKIADFNESNNEQDEIRKVVFVNVHLRPPLNDDGSATLWTAWMTNVYRLNEIKYLFQYLQDNGLILDGNATCPIVILGDYNEHDKDPSLEYLRKSQIFQDAVYEFVPQNRETHRWPLKFFGGLYTYWSFKRLDHCSYSKQWLKCLDCKVMDGYENNASDHQPILSKFSLLLR